MLDGVAAELRRIIKDPQRRVRQEPSDERNDDGEAGRAGENARDVDWKLRRMMNK